MTLLFWACTSLIVVTYAGYPLYLYLNATLRPRPVRRRIIFPTVTIVMAVHNEEKCLPAKLDNFADLDYPRDRLEVIVVSDGSSDQTSSILGVWQSNNHRSLILPERVGKASALNYGIAQARGEIICFVDSRQEIACDGLKNLISNFADTSVGCASGELILREHIETASSKGVGVYWRLEKNIRKWEGLTGSTVGTTGAFYAVRKGLLPFLPEGTILDDVYIPLHTARLGRRIVFDSNAIAWDDLAPSPKQEFWRKVRTLSGNYQLLQLAPWILTRANPLLLRLICHKLLRLFVPFALVGILVSTFWLRHGLYEVVLALQLSLYGLASLTALHFKIRFLSRLSNISLAFVVLNMAAAVAFVCFITGRKIVWVR